MASGEDARQSLRWRRLLCVFGVGCALLWLVCYGMSRLVTTRVREAAALSERVDAVAKVATVIRRMADGDRLLELSLVEAATLRLVEFQHNERVYGADIVPTVTQMIQARRKSGSIFLRGDCKTRAVFAAALLGELGIRYEVIGNPIQAHVWIRTGGTDLLAIESSNDIPRWRNRLVRGSQWFGFSGPSGTTTLVPFSTLIGHLGGPEDAMLLGFVYPSIGSRRLVSHIFTDWEYAAPSEAFQRAIDDAVPFAAFPFGERKKWAPVVDAHEENLSVR